MSTAVAKQDGWFVTGLRYHNLHETERISHNCSRFSQARLQEITARTLRGRFVGFFFCVKKNLIKHVFFMELIRLLIRCRHRQL